MGDPIHKWLGRTLGDLVDAADEANQLQARVVELEAALEVASSYLADLHDDGPECSFHGAEGDDIGCLACLAQAAIYDAGVWETLPVEEGKP